MWKTWNTDIPDRIRWGRLTLPTVGYTPNKAPPAFRAGCLKAPPLNRKRARKRGFSKPNTVICDRSLNVKHRRFKQFKIWLCENVKQWWNETPETCYTAYVSHLLAKDSSVEINTVTAYLDDCAFCAAVLADYLPPNSWRGEWQDLNLAIGVLSSKVPPKHRSPSSAALPLPAGVLMALCEYAASVRIKTRTDDLNGVKVSRKNVTWMDRTSVTAGILSTLFDFAARGGEICATTGMHMLMNLPLSDLLQKATEEAPCLMVKDFDKGFHPEAPSVKMKLRWQKSKQARDAGTSSQPKTLHLVTSLTGDHIPLTTADRHDVWTNWWQCDRLTKTETSSHRPAIGAVSASTSYLK